MTIPQILEKASQLYSQSDLDGAENLVRQVLAANPNIPQAHFMLGLISLQIHDYFIAEQAFKSAINIDEKMTSAWVNLAKVFALTDQPENCQEALSETISLKPDDPRVWEILGHTFQKLGQIEDANIWLTKAAKAFPDAISVNTSKIFNHIYLGEASEAKSNINRMLKLHPNEAYLHYAFSKMEKAEDRSHIEVMQNIKKNTQNNDNLYILDYALGKECEDLQDWDMAFSCFEAGAKAKRQTVEYDEDDQAAFFEYLKNSLNKDWLKSAKSDIESASPIFITGLPRTGTTLVEQMIAAHSKIKSAGELQHIPILVKNLSEAVSDPSIPSDRNSIFNVDVQILAERYLKSTEAYSRHTPYFTDKLPQNFFYIPLIAAAFPNAKILHLRRDPMDSCFSNYKQLFTEKYYYSYDLGEMARYYVQYHDLMDTWRALVPNRIFDIDYEDLVSDFEPTSKAIIKHLGLDWEDTCLEFYNQKSTVATASATQVREKAHIKSIGRWKKYQKQLQPMYKILKANGLVT